MAIMTSTDTHDSRKVAVAKAAGSAALGYLLPWTRPARLVARSIRRRRGARSAPAPVVPAQGKRHRSRPSLRTGLVVLAIGGVIGSGVIGGGVVFSAIRRRRNTPPPVAARPPRVEDVPTR